MDYFTRSGEKILQYRCDEYNICSVMIMTDKGMFVCFVGGNPDSYIIF